MNGRELGSAATAPKSVLYASRRLLRERQRRLRLHLAGLSAGRKEGPHAFARSWHLSGDNVWRCFGIVAIGTIITALVGGLVAQLLSLVLVDGLASALGLDPLIAGAIAVAAASVLLAPLMMVWVAVLYFDLRVRRDPPGWIGD